MFYAATGTADIGVAVVIGVVADTATGATTATTVVTQHEPR